MTADVLGTMAASGYGMHGAGSGWWMGGMMLWMVVFWAAACLGVVWLVRPSLERRQHGGEEALGTLDRRFAEGLISFDEYRERKAVLEGKLLDDGDLRPDGPASGGVGI